MIHLLQPDGKTTLCGLTVKQAGLVTDNAEVFIRAVTRCPDCLAKMPHHTEPLVKHYPPDARAHSDAVIVKPDKP